VLLGGSPLQVRPGTGTDGSSFAGIWEAEKINGLPALQLTISRSENTLNGTAGFYQQTRKDVTEPWQVTGETSLKLLSPVVKGKALSFEVRHQRCRGGVEEGPHAKFGLELPAQTRPISWKPGGEEMNEG